MTEEAKQRVAILFEKLSELKGNEDSAIYGAELAIRSREYHHLKNCAMRLIAIDDQIENLTREIRDLQRYSERDEELSQ